MYSIMLKLKKIAVGISGGVDSAVCALLLKQKGFNIEGVFMQNWDIADEKGRCTADEEFKDAQFVCDLINIPLRHVNFVKPYWISVFSELIQDYESGTTPNPDILCNRHIKFNKFYHYAREYLNCDAIATGHYARTTFGSFLENYQPNKKTRLLRAISLHKDQTFFLSQVPQTALQRTMFPLGNYFKKDVKQMAIDAGLEKIAAKKESMGICFIGDRNFKHFISEYIEEKPGIFINIETGKYLGKHYGVHHWTLGQRSRIEGAPKPYYIVKKDVAKNVIYVAPGTDHPSMYSRIIFTSTPHWIHSNPPELEEGNVLQCQFKFQHVEVVINCTICEIQKGLVVYLDSPKRALTAGQFAVFYKNDECLGSAKILSPGPSCFSLFWLLNNIRYLRSVKDNVSNEIGSKLEEPVVFVNTIDNVEIPVKIKAVS